MFKYSISLLLLMFFVSCMQEKKKTGATDENQVKKCSEFSETDCPSPKCTFYKGCKEPAHALKEQQEDLKAEQKKLEEEKAQKEKELETLNHKPENEKTDIEKETEKKLEKELEDTSKKLDKIKKQEEKLEQERKEQERKKQKELNKTASTEAENLVKYNAQFNDYITSFNNPKEPAKWVLLGDGEQNKDDGKYDLPQGVSDYIAGINDVKVGAKKDMSSKNPVVILKSTNELPDLDKAVLKMGNNIDARIQATSAAHKTVKNKNLNMLYVPKFATGQTKNNESYILEELIDVDASHEFQENLYTNLFTQAKTDENIKNKLTEMFKQMTTFACLSNFNDIKYDNLPLAKDIGKVILLDVEKGGGDIMRLLNSEVSEFYIPSEYIETVVNAAKHSNNNFCQSIAKATEDEITKAKKNGDERYNFLKGFADFKVKRGIITGKEKFSAEDIKKAQDALDDDLDKKFVEVFLTDLNNSKQHDSRVVMIDSLNLSMMNDGFKNKGFTYKYFQGSDMTDPPIYAPFRIPLKKLIELELIYSLEFTSNTKNMDNVVSKEDIKSIYF